MKKYEYIQTIENIKADSNIKEKIWNNIVQSEKKEFKQKKSLYMVAAILLVCIFTFSIPTIASHIRSLIINDVPAYESLEPDIEQNVFSTSDTHIKLTVEELLSDGMCIYMTVSYVALDDIGRTWLNEFEMADFSYNTQLKLTPYVENYSISGTNYSYGTYEKKELATESERWFVIILETASRDYDLGKGTFSYPMTDGIKSTELEIDGNVEVLTFELSTKKTVSDLYEPTCLMISPMSYIIYANNYGVYERTNDGEFHGESWLMSNEEYHSLESTYFIMEDGSKYKLPLQSCCATHPTANNYNSDLVLLSGIFRDDTYKPIIFNSNDVVGLEIKGVYYELIH